MSASKHFGPRRLPGDATREQLRESGAVAGVKAYGTWDVFDDVDDYHFYLEQWMAGTDPDSSECSRAIEAFSASFYGRHLRFTDTDNPLVGSFNL